MPLNEPPGGFDVVYSRRVNPDLPGSDLFTLPAQHWFDWLNALESLMKDPTTDNPRVADLSSLPQYPRNEHLMLWKRLVIIYRFINTMVIEILSVSVRPAPPGTPEDPP